MNKLENCASSWFYCRNISRCTAPWTSNAKWFISLEKAVDCLFLLIAIILAGVQKLRWHIHLPQLHFVCLFVCVCVCVCVCVFEFAVKNWRFAADEEDKILHVLTMEPQSKELQCSDHFNIIYIYMLFNPLNAELNPICHLLALLGAHHILHVSGSRVNATLSTF
jgi:hypothetical protein